MNKERHLLPWILGALSATAVAVAITAVSSNKSAPPAPSPMVAAQSTTVPEAQAPAESLAPPAAPLTASAQPPPAAAPLMATPAAAAPEAQSDATAQASGQQAQAAPESAGPSGQIWQCTTKGVKTFSNNPCGDKSSLVEIGPINAMNPTPTPHYARAYPEPRYAPAYTDYGSADQEVYSDQASAEAGNSYTIVQGIGFVPRRRPHHPPMPNHHNPNHHNFGPTPRRS